MNTELILFDKHEEDNLTLNVSINSEEEKSIGFIIMEKGKMVNLIPSTDNWEPCFLLDINQIEILIDYLKRLKKQLK